jgi:hypothetical protein
MAPAASNCMQQLGVKPKTISKSRGQEVQNGLDLRAEYLENLIFLITMSGGYECRLRLNLFSNKLQRTD